MTYPIEYKLFFILFGMLSIAVSLLLLRQVIRTPEGELIPRGFGVYWTRGRMYLGILIGWITGIISILFGVILP